MAIDVLIIGGGVAGLSLGARLAGARRVTVLEAEAACGYHASGRSATFSHFGIGNETVRGLTAASRGFFLAGEAEGLARRAPALFIATEAMLPALAKLEAAMTPHAPALSHCDPAEMTRLFPPLRAETVVAGLLDADGLKLDGALLLQGYVSRIGAGGGSVLTGQRIDGIERRGASWRVAAGGAWYEAPVLVNAAGAWSDEVAVLAGVAPIGLAPLRRTIIQLEAPQGASAWPFVKTVTDDFYILPDGGRLAASPVDEVPSAPGDAQPEDYDIALAAAKVEEYTTLPVVRIAGRWAGLRTFAQDRTPVVGYDDRAEGFFWLAGQGGYGLQTAPALSAAAAALITNGPWPDPLTTRGVEAKSLSPQRFTKGNDVD